MSIIGTVELIAKINTSDYKKGAAEIGKANKDIEGGMSNADTSAKKTNSSLLAFARKGVKIAAVGLLGLGAAITGMALKGGFSRALNIEDAQAKLRGLGHDAKSVNLIMKNALASVKGTAFGLDAAATVAANAVASGVKPGKQLEQVLKTVANTASVAGRDMGDLGAIFNKVAASNKVQMDVINQLQDAGVPALALLSKELGKSASKTAELASAGKINFATFERAMRHGVGDAALAMGNTTRGSLKNMQAAFSRAGAVIADKILPHVRDSIQHITGWVDDVSKKIPGAIDTIAKQFRRIRDAASSATSGLKGGDFKSIGETVGKGIASGLNAALSAISIGATTINKWFGGINWGKLGLSVGRQSVAFVLGFIIGLSDFDMGSAFKLLADNWLTALLGALSLLFAPTKLLKPIAAGLRRLPFGGLLIRFILKPVRGMGAGIRDAFASLFGGVGGVITSKLSVIGTLVKTLGQIIIAPFKLLLEGIENQVRLLPLTIQQAFQSSIGFVTRLLGGFLNITKNIFLGIWNVITTILQPLSSFFSNMFTGIWTNIRGIFSGVGSYFGQTFIKARLSVQDAFGGIVKWFVGRWGAIKNIFSGTASWFGSIFGRAWSNIKGAFSSVNSFFSSMWNNIVSRFGKAGTRVGDAIGNAFKSVINTVIRGAVGIINKFIDAVNVVVGVIKHIPGVGGRISKLSRLSVPQLATGGIVSSPTLAMVGEGREPEAVIPLSKLDNILNSERSTTGRTGDVFNITIPVTGTFATSKAEQRKVAQIIADRFQEIQRAKAVGGRAA